MRKAMLIPALAALVCASLSLAGLDVEKITITSSTAGATNTVYATNSNVRGYIEEIIIDTPAANTTGDLTIAVSPSLSTASDFTLFDTNGLAGDYFLRPRFDGNDADGTILTSDNLWRKAVVGEDIILTLEQCTNTGLVFNVLIKYEKQDRSK